MRIAMPEGSGDGDAARCLYAQVRFVKPGRAISAEDTNRSGWAAPVLVTTAWVTRPCKIRSENESFHFF